MIRYYHKAVKGSALKEIEKWSSGSWIMLEDPEEAEIEEISTKFELSVDLLQDALDQNEVPRFEFDENVLYLFTRFPYRSGEKMGTIPLLIVVGAKFVLTVCQKELPFFDKLEKLKEFSTTQKTQFLLALLWEIDGQYDLFLNRISRSIRSIRIQIESLDNKDIIRFVSLEEILNDALAALTPIATIFLRLKSKRSLRWKEEQKEELDDLHLSNGELRELCRTNLRTIVNIREAYSTIMTNNLNRVIRILTALTIVLTIPTIVGTLYGMNVALPLADSPLAFWWVLGITAGISVLILTLFWRNKWL